jgi:hypothetical protein
LDTGAAKKLGHHAVHPVNVKGELEYMNSDSMVAKKQGLYYASVPYEELGDFAGPDLLTLWYQRNIRIYHNIVRMIESLNN